MMPEVGISCISRWGYCIVKSNTIDNRVQKFVLFAKLSVLYKFIEARIIPSPVYLLYPIHSVMVTESIHYMHSLSH